MTACSLQDAFDGRPFAQLLTEQGLGPDVRSLLLYAVAMLETDQVMSVCNETSKQACTLCAIAACVWQSNWTKQAQDCVPGASKIPATRILAPGTLPVLVGGSWCMTLSYCVTTTRSLLANHPVPQQRTPEM